MVHNFLLNNKKVTRWLILGLILFLWQVPATARELTDQTGRKVTVPESPKRVVALAPNIVEIIFALSREDRLVGATQFTNYPPPAAKIPKIGTYIRPDLEKIVALSPDVCIAVRDGNPIEVIRRLEELRIPVYAVDPRDLHSVEEVILRIGDLLNASPEANSLVASLDRRIERVRNAAQNVNQQPTVFFQIGVNPIVSTGTNTHINELIVTAGGINLARGDNAYPVFSREEVLALSPEVIVITSMTRGESFKRVKEEWVMWPDLPAVKKDRIYVVDSDLFDRPSPRLVDGLEVLFRLLHPEVGELK
jgi:iron complex transport system substrate-binding protein